jgi:hypothetical protein
VYWYLALSSFIRIFLRSDTKAQSERDRRREHLRSQLSLSLLSVTTMATSTAAQAPFTPQSTPPTTPRATIGNAKEGRARLDALHGSLAVDLRFESGLVLSVLVEKTTTIGDLRRGLLRVAGGSLCRDEAILLSTSGQLFEEPWETPFRKLVASTEVFEIIVRKAQTVYYRDLVDRREDDTNNSAAP